MWHFVKKFSDQMDKHIDTVPPQVLDDLKRYHWPGNIRELQNVIERAVILSPGNVLKLSRAEQVHEPEWQPVAHSTNGSSKTATLSECEREHILQALEATHWIVGGPSGAAVLLGVKRTTLLSKMQKLGISRKTKLPQQSSLATAAAD